MADLVFKNKKKLRLQLFKQSFKALKERGAIDRLILRFQAPQSESIIHLGFDAPIHLEMAAMEPFAKNGPFWIWPRHTPFTELSQAHCQLHDLSTGEATSFDPTPAQTNTSEDGDNGTMTNSYQIELPIPNGDKETFKLTFSRTFIVTYRGKKRKPVKDVSPFIDVKAEGDYPDNRSMVWTQRSFLNADTGGVNIYGILQRGSVQAFKAKFTVYDQGERGRPGQYSDPYELRCSLGPVNQAKFTPNPLI